MPEPLFILCPPRSYSSIVCGIIGQHPDCYSLPELNLFLGDDLGEVWTTTAFMRSFGQDGLLRALAQLHDGEQTSDTVAKSREWVARHFNWPVRKVFDYIQELVGPRILVEKSPSTVFRREFLDRMVRNFPSANYLHLARHPRGTSESILTLRANHEQLKRLFGDNPRADPERIWRSSHEMIVSVTSGLALGQCMRLKGEPLLSDLELYLPQICEWLGISADVAAMEAMMHPEHSPYARPGPPGAERGNDPNFLSHPEIDRDRLARLREPTLVQELGWRPGEFFKPETKKLAKQLGYA